MNTPDFKRHFGDGAVELVSAFAQSVAEDMARRLVKMGVSETTLWQMDKLREAGYLTQDVLAEIEKLTGGPDGESPLTQAVRDAFTEAAVRSVEYDNRIYAAAGNTPVALHMSPSMMRILQRGIATTEGELVNLVRTTALTSQTAFIQAWDLAYMQVTSGAMSYTQAISQAVKRVGGDGVYVMYPSGHRDTIEVATRRAVLSGASKTCGEISLANARMMDVSLFEVTAHSGARPQHQLFQGKVYRWNQK